MLVLTSLAILVACHMIAHFLLRKTLFWKLFRKLHGGVDSFKSLKFGVRQIKKWEVARAFQACVRTRGRLAMVGMELQGGECVEWGVGGAGELQELGRELSEMGVELWDLRLSDWQKVFSKQKVLLAYIRERITKGFLRRRKLTKAPAPSWSAVVSDFQSSCWSSALWA